MSTGAIVLMVAVLSIVWGGLAATLWAAYRQEQRRRGGAKSKPGDR